MDKFCIYLYGYTVVSGVVFVQASGAHNRMWSKAESGSDLSFNLPVFNHSLPASGVCIVCQLSGFALV